MEYHVILIRYLTCEIFKSQFIILSILISIFFCQRLTHILNIVENGNVPLDSVLFLLILDIPWMVKLILPLSLFLGSLITLNRMHNNKEIIVIYACGISKNILIQATWRCSLVTMLLTLLNVAWISPISLRYQDIIKLQSKYDVNMIMLESGKFKIVENGNSELFIKNVNGKSFENIFLARLTKNSNNFSSIIVAKSGYVIRSHNGRLITIVLCKGDRYEWNAMSYFRIVNFSQYRFNVDNQKIKLKYTNTEKMTLYQLLCSLDKKCKLELHWRLILILSILIMAMIAVPLSYYNLRNSQPIGVFLYLFFFFSQSSMYYLGIQKELNSILWMWLLNTLYFVIAIILNHNDSVFFRKICFYLKKIVN